MREYHEVVAQDVLSRVSAGLRCRLRSYSRGLSRHSCVLAVSRPWQVVTGHAGRSEVPLS